MLMAWGPFRFTVPNYSVETIQRSIQPRVEAQPVIGAMPPVHRLGPGNETITLESTFHPRHLNGRGLAQLAGVRQAVNALTPMMLAHINGAGINIFGLWIATSINDDQTVLDASGTPQTVTASLSLMQYGGGGARGAALAAVLGGASFGASLVVDPARLGVRAGVGF